MNAEHSVEWELAGETEVLGENLLQCHFLHQKSHMIWNPGRRGGKPATNRLCYGTAIRYLRTKCMILRNERNISYNPSYLAFLCHNLFNWRGFSYSWRKYWQIELSRVLKMATLPLGYHILASIQLVRTYWRSRHRGNGNQVKIIIYITSKTMPLAEAKEVTVDFMRPKLKRGLQYGITRVATFISHYGLAQKRNMWRLQF
jgi:hypothetical protein